MCPRLRIANMIMSPSGCVSVHAGARFQLPDGDGMWNCVEKNCQQHDTKACVSVLRARFLVFAFKTLGKIRQQSTCFLFLWLSSSVQPTRRPHQGLVR